MPVPLPSRSVLFLGVSTGASAVHRVFPGWMAALGLSAGLEGVDLPLGADPSAYRAFVERIRGDEAILGAGVTSHKAGVFAACALLFDDVSADARMLHEVAGISRRDERLRADAPDVRSVARAAARLLEDRRWTAGCHDAVILGAGGAGLCLAYALAHGSPAHGSPAHGSPPDGAPSLGVRGIVLTEADPTRLSVVETIVGAWRHADAVRVEPATRDVNDRLVRGAGPGALIVNATGRGKDRPGSPLSAAAFPHEGIVWDFNYRGELDFLRQARAQATERDLLVSDGRDYLVAGWMEALCFVTGRDAGDDLLARFETAARAVGI